MKFDDAPRTAHTLSHLLSHLGDSLIQDGQIKAASGNEGAGSAASRGHHRVTLCIEKDRSPCSLECQEWSLHRIGLKSPRSFEAIFWKLHPPEGEVEVAVAHLDDAVTVAFR